MIGRFAPYLSYEMMWGKHYIWGGETEAPMGIKTGKQGKGIVGLGYAISERVLLFAGATPQDYDPAKFFNKMKTPYKSSGLLLKVNVNVWD